MTPPPAALAPTLEALDALVAFDTVSAKPNRALADWAAARLAALGARVERVPDEGGGKVGLIASFGPADAPGVALSGHTDVVPVEGQAWTSDPFALRVAGGRAYGRGAADMKGFLACLMASAPAMAAAALARPLHLVLSYDEEVGCLGVRPLLARIGEWAAPPAMAIIGEPTLMGVVLGHKAKRSMRVEARGRAGHSALAPRAANAVQALARLAAAIADRAEHYERAGARDDLYDVPHTTVHVGALHGGAALNIVPDRAHLLCEVRAIGADDPDAEVAWVRARAAAIEARLREVAPEASLALSITGAYPGLDTDPAAPVAALARRLAGRNAHAKVAFGTEAGLFAAAGIPAAVVGPGSIAQAHEPDEFVEIAELERCNAFLARLIGECRAG